MNLGSGGDPAQLRIASYNIYKGHFFDTPGPRGGTVLEDLSRVRALLRADVLALQEAVVGPLRSNGASRDTVREIAQRFGLDGTTNGHTQFAGTPHGRGTWGVALVCRQRADFHPVTLPRPFWSPWQRGAILARYGAWVVGTLHLEVWPLGAPARRRQMRALLAAVDVFAGDSATPVVLAGDFNCQRGGPHDILRQAGFVPALERRVPTFALAGVRLHLDHIYVRGARVLDAGVEHGARGSDHWPVWADVACEVRTSK
jgi:endonuclease/exonuclease/phosphatase family metal-dependent hydrolase